MEKSKDEEVRFTKMKGDTNPSVIFGLYTQPDRYELLMQRLKEKKIPVREIRFIDVPIDMERYDEIINFFKEFCYVDYWKDRHPINIVDRSIYGFNLKEKVESNTARFKFVDFRKANWRNSTKHELLLTLCVPLMYQDQTMYCETDEERENMKRLANFESSNYMNDEDRAVKEELDKIEKEAEQFDRP